MSRTVKNCLIFLVMLLPVAAFADNSTGLHLFTVPTSDFSVSLLERTFGAVGSVLHGKGNQIVGLLLGIFNAMWVIVIGLGILFLVWDSVMTAAHSGEMMQRNGKKAAFTIIRIVVGFCLVVPSSSTGYSMAQTGVVWAVVQGVGLADEITEKVHDYAQAGGQTFTPKPSSATEIEPLMSVAADILKAEVCMFKVQDFLDQKKKEEDEALKGTGVEPNPPSEFDKMGYSINVGTTSGSVTFGSKNPNYSPDDPTTGTEYLSDCGEAHWNLVLPLPDATESQAASMKKTLAGYMQAGVTDLVVTLQPLARELASADLSDTDENTENFKKIADRAATAIAGAGVSYTTLIDPIRGAIAITGEQGLKTRLTHLNERGWVFMPMMVVVPGLYSVDSLNMESYMPAVTPPNLVLNEPANKIKVLSSEQRQEIMDAIVHVETDNYVTLATNQLKLMDTNNEWPKIDFKAMFTVGTPDGNYINNLSVIFDGTREIMNAGRLAANGMLEVPKGLMQGIKSIADFFVDGFDIGVPEVCIGDLCAPDISVHIPGVGGDTSGLQNAIDKISNLQSSLNDSVNGAIGNLNTLVSDIQNSATLAEKGGMTSELIALTGQLGPLGPMYATVMTAMIGKSITSFENYVFSSNTNALVSSIQLGGDMMVGAMKSVFLGGKIMFISTLVQAGMNGLSQIVGMIPGGKVVGGVMDVGTNLVHKGIESFTGFHIALSLLMFAGGVMLYFMVPLTFIVAFASICLRWIGMVLINILAAPIFCFNLIRADSEGLAGRGERFLGDLAKTVLTPALLAIGAIAFVILFNIGFMIVTTVFSAFLPMLAKAYNSAILIPVTLTLILLTFSAMMLYLATTLSTLCTTDFVNQVTSTIGDTIQQLQDQQPTQEIRTRIQEGSQYPTDKVKGMASGGSGIMAKDKQ
ncbi:MAG TPA: DotA/TraY family protein [Gammaproteobacteria bacterium]|nr:DotA/TraY family protein [Gammaproteobacteria bacterium]